MKDKIAGQILRILENEHNKGGGLEIFYGGWNYLLKSKSKSMFYVIEGNKVGFYIDMRKLYVEYDVDNVDNIRKERDGEVEGNEEFTILPKVDYRSKAYGGYGVLLLEVDFFNMNFRYINRLDTSINFVTSSRCDVFNMNTYKEFCDNVGGMESFALVFCRCVLTIRS